MSQNNIGLLKWVAIESSFEIMVKFESGLERENFRSSADPGNDDQNNNNFFLPPAVSQSLSQTHQFTR